MSQPADVGHVVTWAVTGTNVRGATTATSNGITVTAAFSVAAVGGGNDAAIRMYYDD